MIFLFSREPDSFDKLRVKDKKIYSDYLDEWDRSTHDFYFVAVGAIVMGFGYFLEFQEADLPKKVVVWFVMAFNFVMHLQVFFVRNPPYLDQMSYNLEEAYYQKDATFAKKYLFLKPLHFLSLMSSRADNTVLKIFILINCV